ncbi:MAG: DUF3240 family protein [Methylovulum sp.]|uniref:DUF3240 family protein n=1 Tax=Methylovulum sp. TaxID=1916980 RepID=UPI0026239CF1|nr:DUF3240 family protein [Methylovulum sp.]MDD2724773.1 DUF3240 family protein [Methylovulum sp.]MDD5125938.1 DUF3240 family protein [Methylovulum sp.]
MTHTEYLLTLNLSPSLEEAVVDTLLMLEAEHGFSSFPVNAHHHENQGLSLAEQVSGRQKRVRIQMYVDTQGLVKLLSQLKQEFAGAGIQYWVLPVIEKGVI